MCDFLEMIDISELTTHIPTIKRGHYGLLEPSIKLQILKVLVDQVTATDLVREMLDERLEERHALAASKRGEALEEGKKKREAKERLKAVSETNGIVPEHNSDTAENVSSVAVNNEAGLENGNAEEKISSAQKDVLQNGSVSSLILMEIYYLNTGCMCCDICLAYYAVRVTIKVVDLGKKQRSYWKIWRGARTKGCVFYISL